LNQQTNAIPNRKLQKPRELNPMNQNTIKSIAIACGLTLTLSLMSATSFARGSGHSSRGTGRSGRSMSSRNTFFRQGFDRGFASNRYQNFSMRGRYYGWGYYAPSGYNYGWGWGCYNSPYYYSNTYASYGDNSYGSSYGNSSYGNNSYGNNSYGNNSYGNNYAGNSSNSGSSGIPANAPGPPSTPNPPTVNGVATTPAIPQPAGQPTPAVASTAADSAGQTAPGGDEQTDAAEETSPSTAAAKPTPPAPPAPPTASEQPADAAKPAAPPAPADPLVGTFKANPAKDVQIELTMRADTTFTWKFTAGGKSQTFSGLYDLGPNSLGLTRDGGEKMDGTLERVGTTGFKFRMKGAPSEDPGLTFTR
jgi:hypothetical protein